MLNCEADICGRNGCPSCMYSKNNVLKGIDADDLVYLENHRSPSKYKAGSIIARAGSSHTQIWCISSGVVMSTLPRERDRIIDVFVPGDFVGISDFGSDKRIPFDLIAHTDCYLCQIKNEYLESLLKKNIHFTKKFIAASGELYLSASKRSIYMAQLPMKGRLALAIIYIAEKVGIDHDNKLNLYLKRKQWASLSYMNTSNAIRSFTALSEQGLIRIIGKNLIIPDMNQLKKYLETLLSPH